MIKNYKELHIWQQSSELCVIIYKLTCNNNFTRDYSLKDQIRRSSISVPSNIAEGFSRGNNNEFIHFLKIAKGSSSELENQLYISKKIGYITTEELQSLEMKITEINSRINKFLAYLLKRRQNKLTKQTQQTKQT